MQVIRIEILPPDEQAVPESARGPTVPAPPVTGRPDDQAADGGAAPAVAEHEASAFGAAPEAADGGPPALDDPVAGVAPPATATDEGLDAGAAPLPPSAPQT